MFALGTNTIVDGFTQLAGANRGNGYNVLGEASQAAGAGIARLVGRDPNVGRMVGEGVFVVTSIAVGSLGSIRILKVSGQAFLRVGLANQPGGVAMDASTSCMAASARKMA